MAERAQAGRRIRARRLECNLTQAALARAAGISASYLNLIEHERRRIGGKLLSDIARILDADPAALGAGAAAGVIDGLSRAAGQAGASRIAPEVARAPELAELFPGWAGLIAAQGDRIAGLERTVAALGDRLSHDPALSAAVHEVLSTVTAIRATSAILIEAGDLDAEWRGRFHRNIHEESRRLAEGARALARHLTAGGGPVRDATTPQEEVEAWLGARNHHVAELERDPAADPEVLIGDWPAGAARALLIRHLRRYAEDAAALPQEALARAIARHGPDPLALAEGAGGDPARVMRRLAALPEAIAGAPLGLVVADGAGAVTLRRAVPGFDLPRFGAVCALWPLTQALLAPQRPLAATLEQGGSAARPFRAWATARIAQPAGFDGPLVAEATMLIAPADLWRARPRETPLRVGSSCRICAVPGCSARREPSILAEVAF